MAGVMTPAPAKTPAKKVRWRHRGASKNARWRHYGASKIDSLVSFFGVVIVFPFPFLGLAFQLSASADCSRELQPRISGRHSRLRFSVLGFVSANQIATENFPTWCKQPTRCDLHGAGGQLGVSASEIRSVFFIRS